MARRPRVERQAVSVLDIFRTRRCDPIQGELLALLQVDRDVSCGALDGDDGICGRDESSRRLRCPFALRERGYLAAEDGLFQRVAGRFVSSEPVRRLWNTVVAERGVGGEEDDGANGEGSYLIRHTDDGEVLADLYIGLGDGLQDLPDHVGGDRQCPFLAAGLARAGELKRPLRDLPDIESEDGPTGTGVSKAAGSGGASVEFAWLDRNAINARPNTRPATTATGTSQERELRGSPALAAGASLVTPAYYRAASHAANRRAMLVRLKRACVDLPGATISRRG